MIRHSALLIIEKTPQYNDWEIFYVRIVLRLATLASLARFARSLRSLIYVNILQAAFGKRYGSPLSKRSCNSPNKLAKHININSVTTLTSEASEDLHL